MTQSSWDDVISYAELEYFVGREFEQDIFRRQLKAAPPRHVIYYITGQAGVGKTTLLTRYRQIASEIGYIIADCDEQQKDVPTILGRFAHQCSEQGFPLKHFNERYEVYYQRMHEIENDPEAPQGLAALIGKTLVRAAFVGGDILPGVRKGLEFLPRESIETQASEWAGYLAKKLRSKDEVTLLRDPVSILTPLFFEGLNEITERRQVLLCFDNFHATRQVLEEWLLHLREYKPSVNIRIAIASQDLPGARWDTLRKVTLTIHLDTFTQQEAEAFLDTYGIMDTDRRREILEFSDRLPVLMSWLSAPEGQDADPTPPTHDIVERFLRWIPEMSLRQVALIAAIPHTFNLDILRILLSDSSQSVSVLSAFDWLLTMPFVQQRSDSWQYHNVVRRMLLRYQRQKSPQDYKYLHNILANFYNVRRKEIKSSIGKEWTNEEWRKCTLAYIYHFLVVDSSQHWSEILDLFIIALRRRRSFAVEIIELLHSDDVHDELSREKNDLIKILKEQLQNINKSSIENGFEMFDRLVKVAGLNSQAKSVIFGYRAEAYRRMERYEEALIDFSQAITLNNDDAWAFGSRGETYRLLERYEEALTDFSRAITLNNDYAWAFAHRGETYRLLERYEEALADFERSIDLDKETCAFLHRADLYRGMGRYKEALADYDRAILYERPAKAFSHRGELYRALGRYEEALADYERAIDLDKETCAFLHRADLYRMLGQYEEALADYDRAVTLDAISTSAFVHRGEIYRKMGRYEEALADYDRAVTLGEDNYTTKGLLLSYLGRYREAIENYELELRKEPSSVSSLYNIAVAMFRWKGLPDAQVHIDKARHVLLSSLDTEMRGSALYGLGGLEALAKNFEQAIDYFEQAAPLTKSVYDWVQHDIAWADMHSNNERLRNLILRK